jgi:hypothetical protein
MNNVEDREVFLADDKELAGLGWDLPGGGGVGTCR